MAKNTYPTPMLDELEHGPWPSFITGIKRLREAGDRVVIFLESYRPTRVAVRKFLPRYGIQFDLVSLHDAAAIEAAFAKPDTKAVLFESPTIFNPRDTTT